MNENKDDTGAKINYGKIISVRGSVVDVTFENNLPPIYTLLRSGKNKQVSIEVLSQLDDHTVRGIALNPTQGLARGMVVETNGKELTVPVGKNILGRMFDVFGNTIDHLDPLPEGERRIFTSLRHPYQSGPLNQKFLKPVLKPSTCWYHWNVEEKQDYLGEPA
jgi:F0F1-type ATP synthase beta subunit